MVGLSPGITRVSSSRPPLEEWDGGGRGQPALCPHLPSDLEQLNSVIPDLLIPSLPLSPVAFSKWEPLYSAQPLCHTDLPSFIRLPPHLIGSPLRALCQDHSSVFHTSTAMHARGCELPQRKGGLGPGALRQRWLCRSRKHLLFLCLSLPSEAMGR